MQISEFKLHQPLQNHQPVGFATSRHDIALHNYIERRKARVAAEATCTLSIPASIKRLVRGIGSRVTGRGRVPEEQEISSQI